MKKIKLLFLSVISLFICTPNVFAFYGNMTSSYDRSNMPNSGVNKKWEITSYNSENVSDTPYVDASLKVYDYSDVLNDAEETSLKDTIAGFKNKHNMEMIILTADLPYSYDKYNETVATDFYDYNDFGIDFKHYDGILLFRNTYNSDPYFDMYTFGEAQLYFNDERYNYVLDNIYDDLKNHHYLSGFNKFIYYCDAYIDSGIPENYKGSYIEDDKNSIVYGEEYYNSSEYYKFNGGTRPMTKAEKSFIAGIISLIATLIFFFVNKAKCKMIIKAANANDYLDRGSINYKNKEDRFISTHTSRVRISSDSSGGGGGGHSSFGSSGGGHSSGGGRHG